MTQLPTDPTERGEFLKTQAHKPVHIGILGIAIGGEEFPYPILEGSVKVEPYGHRYNTLTVTLLVGDVTMERRKSSFPDVPDAKPQP